MDNSIKRLNTLSIEVKRLSNRLAYHWDNLSFSEKIIIIQEIKNLLKRLVEQEHLCSDH